MLAEVVALPFDEWQAWYDREAQEIKDAEEFAADAARAARAERGRGRHPGHLGASTLESDTEEPE